MKSFGEISRMNLADLDSPNDANNKYDEADSKENTDGQDREDTGVETEGGVSDSQEEHVLTVADIEGLPEEEIQENSGADAEEEIRQPEGRHYYFEAKVTEKELTSFLFGHNYRQPLMIIAMIVALVWPVMVIVRNDKNLMLAIALAAIVLVALPFSTWSRGKRTVKNNPAYKQIFYYMVDEWGLHLKLGKEAIDVEWKSINKCMFLKSVTVLYTGKINAFLLPTAAMGEQAEDINHFIKEMIKK